MGTPHQEAGAERAGGKTNGHDTELNPLRKQKRPAGSTCGALELVARRSGRMGR